jgi:hypothetical protein
MMMVIEIQDIPPVQTDPDLHKPLDVDHVENVVESELKLTQHGDIVQTRRKFLQFLSAEEHVEMENVKFLKPKEFVYSKETDQKQFMGK